MIHSPTTIQDNDIAMVLFKLQMFQSAPHCQTFHNNNDAHCIQTLQEGSTSDYTSGRLYK
jgi:hypothetical protein